MSPSSSAVYRTPDESFASLPGYPFTPRYQTVDGMRLHYVDEGSGPPCLLLHGEPTWSFLYRKMIPILTAAGLRAVAPDYFGFGRSDKPTELAAYSYLGHVRAMRQLVESLDLRDILLVVHDWGGPIGLRLATLMPERIGRLVILDTGLFTPTAPRSETLRRWREHVASQPDLDVAEAVRLGCARPLSPQDAAGYAAPFPTFASRAGARAFPMLVPSAPSDPGAFEMTDTLHKLGQHRWPTLVLWGDSDPIFPVHIGEYFAQLFAGADLNLIEGAGHFLPEDSGPELAKRIVEFSRSSW